MIIVPVPQCEEGVSPLPPPSRQPHHATPSLPPSASGRPQRQRKPSSRAISAAAQDTTPRTRSATAESSPLSSVSPAPSSSRKSTPEITIPAFAKSSPALQRDLARVWEAINGSRRIVVVCGAGISVSAPASIPDFRSSTGLFKSLKEQHPNAGLSSGKDLFDARLFQSESNTALFYSMIASLHAMTLSAQPTLFHHFLKRLDEQGRLQRVYTQNIDALEERAGLSFGLGEGTASRTFKRTASLGKRKRVGGGSAEQQEQPATQPQQPTRRQAWNKVQSAPVGSLFGPSPEPTTAMFPRVIPLHGSLSNLVCTVCDYKMAILPDATPQAASALDALNQGEPPHCPECHERDAVRVAAGLRSRGIGLMKPDVVLYNGPNKSGERVGECLERDVLGLRDRLDGRVPETYTEEKLRRKKEDKQRDRDSDAREAPGDESFMSIVSEQGDQDDVLGRVFEEEEEENQVEEETASSSSPAPAPTKVAFAAPSAEPSPTAKLLQGVRARKSLQRATTQPAPTSAHTQKTSKAKHMKPLPPDLLIVAGTSLKVPGTKRVVREFAKAARARDGIVPKGCKSRLNKRSGAAVSASAASRGSSKTSSGNGGSDSESGGSDGGDSDDDGDDDDDPSSEDGTNPYRPIRTILLNYDFPIPSKEWEGVFDVWVQGDVQAAAAGLWSASSGYGMGNPLQDEDEEEDVAGIASWEAGIDGLDDEREATKKAERAGKKKQPTAAAAAVAAVATPTSSSTKARSRATPVVEIESKVPPKRAAGKTSTGNLAPSRKANGGGSVAQQATVDRMFAPTKRSYGRSVSGGGGGGGGGGKEKQKGAGALRRTASVRKAVE